MGIIAHIIVRFGLGILKKMKKLCDEFHLTQKKMAAKIHIRKSSYLAYSLKNSNSKSEALVITKAPEMRPEFLSLLTFRAHHKFAHAILENKDWMHTWNNSTWIKTDDYRRSYTRKS